MADGRARDGGAWIPFGLAADIPRAWAELCKQVKLSMRTALAQAGCGNVCVEATFRGGVDDGGRHAAI